jgi:rod shape-determining protein MreC
VIIRIKKISPYIAILCLAVIFLIFQPSLYSRVKSWLLDSFSLPIKIINLPLQEGKKILFYRSIARENLILKNQVNALKRRIVNQEEVAQENERFRKLLSFKNKSAFSLIAARVIARDPSNWESVVIIDKGKNEGVKKDMAAITELGLAGKVLEVGNNTSKIALINDPNFSVAGVFLRSREEGIVSGTINGICRMKYLSLDSDVKLGDIVVTSGLSQDIPKGILIGSVTEEEAEASNLTKNCLIKPAVNFSKLEEVLLVIP